MLSKVFTRAMAARVINSAFFYGGWTALVVFAAEGAPGKGLLILMAILAVHFYLSHQRMKDAIFLISVTIAGCIIDTCLQAFGVLMYASPNPYISWISPFWMMGVYVLFAAAVDYSLIWMRSYLLAAAILGAIGGVMSYIAGAKLGGVEFLLPNEWSLVVIGIVWFIFMPVSCWYSGWLDRRVNPHLPPAS